ncbi:MAG TPA: hypothetical protein V6D07_04400 [Trichocoleus sp.]
MSSTPAPQPNYPVATHTVQHGLYGHKLRSVDYRQISSGFKPSRQSGSSEFQPHKLAHVIALEAWKINLHFSEIKTTPYRYQA